MNKKKYLLLILPLTLIFLFNGKKYEDEVIKRIHIAANICVEGAECGAASVSSSTDIAGSAPSTQIYAAMCILFITSSSYFLPLNKKIKVKGRMSSKYFFLFII